VADPTDKAVEAAAEMMVRELFGRTCRVGSMHREVAKAVLVAAEPHRGEETTTTGQTRDGTSTLSSVTERAAEQPGQRASWRSPVPPRPPVRAGDRGPFGFGPRGEPDAEPIE
jgi:hypothetical protein